MLTINELINEYKVVLNRLLVNLSEVGLGNGDEAVAIFEDERSIRVAPASQSIHDLKAELQAHFVTATRYKLFIRTWKKLVDPRVTMGDRTSLLETTCIRNTSAMERL